jgi:hypothetical protein
MSLRITHASPSILRIRNTSKSSKQYKSNRSSLSSTVILPISPINSNRFSAPEFTSRLDRRAPKARSDEIRWADLLEKFRSVQLRHEKARTRQLLLPRGPHIDAAPSTPIVGPKRNVSVAHQTAAPPPSHKRGGRSIHTITQGIMNVGRGTGDAKKNTGGGKRG